jgi:hypothetical protein
VNITPESLDRAYQAALTSGKVESKRLARAIMLIPTVQHTFTGTYTDGSHMDEYWVPGSDRTGYAITVRNNRIVGGCQCKDHGKNRPMICKHRAAIMLITRALQLEPVTNDVVPVTVPLPADYRARLKAALWPEDGNLDGY